ncbi:MAG: HAD family hydrolase [Verrucomicrobiia bacterium]
MRPRAVIFDAYGTLLDLRHETDGVEERWRKLFAETFGRLPDTGFSDTAEVCRKVVARLHAQAKALGIGFPEVVWPSVMCEVLPALRELARPGLDGFIYRYCQLTRTTTLNPVAAALLPRLKAAGVLLGIASNAQAYTLREMHVGFVAVGLDWTRLFERNLCFWSFQHGFSKPDPHVFQILTTRLGAEGISPPDILMVGDRLDNDVAPARAHGWQTWWLNADPGRIAGGEWPVLSAAL